jgi:16S rRNA processing protein RimM
VEKWVELGRIGSPFGVRGWVHVESFTDPPERLLEYSLWHVRVASGERSSRRLIEARPQGQHFVARLEGLEDRDQAAALRGAFVEVPRNELPPPGERQYYRADLVGCAVCNLEGVELGEVQYFVDAPAGAVMVVKGEREHWVLATPQHLRKVDLAARSIIVDWPVELE